MLIKIKSYFAYLYLLIPLFLITGPAIPDITITFGGIFFLLWFFFYERKHDLIEKNNFFYITIIFWISLIFVSFFAINKEKSFQDSLIFIRILLIPICCYFVFFSNLRIFYYLSLFISILVVLISIDSIFQFYNYSPKEGFGKDILGFKSNWYGRLTGPFGKELIPGSYVSKFALIGYVFFLLNNNLRNVFWIQIIYLSSVLVVTFISGERMAFATYFLGMFVLLILLKENRRVIFFSIILGLITIFFIYKTHPFYNDFKVIESNEYHQGLKIEKNIPCDNDIDKVCTKIINIQPNFIKVISNFSSSAYGEIYLLALEMFKDNFITGIGINNYKLLCETNEYYKIKMVNYECASHPHNIYLQWLTEGGLIVFFAFIIYLFTIVKLIISNVGLRKYKIISLVLILILFWPIMSTGSLIKNWYGVSTFFIIGITLCISKIKEDF